MKKPTIKDVAKLAQVSVSTVSLVLNQKSSVSDQTKNKILQAIKELDYHPRRIARGLASHTTGNIGSAEVYFSIIAEILLNVNLLFIFFVVFGILLIFGFSFRNEIFIFLSGCLILIVGIAVFSLGIKGYHHLWWEYPFGWILVGIGLFLSIVAAYEFVNKSEIGEDIW